jgi:hypothetical protein
MLKDRNVFVILPLVLVIIYDFTPIYYYYV